jgi:tRNA/tmRNA/rRNA uracil-C5-methylase (TrmA/RlmC/RlmD family)
LEKHSSSKRQCQARKNIFTGTKFNFLSDIKKASMKKSLTLGLHARDYSKIIDLKECKIQDEALSAIAWDCAGLGKRRKVYTAYNERYDRGFLKYLNS